MTYDIISKRKTLMIRHPDVLFQFLKRYTKSRQEHFFVITLNNSTEIIGIHISTIGLVNKTIIHPREVFIHAITDNAVSIIIAHNHSSSNLKPSDEDIEITKRLNDAGVLLGINVIDHLIINKYGYYSFRKETDILQYIT
jgi:DNA repair protein RadC